MSQSRLQDFAENRANNFDLLRFLMAGAVLVYHCFPLLYGIGHVPDSLGYRLALFSGGAAVSSFFVISGYLVTQSWVRNPQIGAFFAKRVLRIYPAFIGASLFCALVVGPLGTVTVHEYFAQFNVFGFIGYMALLVGPFLPPVFANLPLPNAVDGSFWTLRYEFECYVLVAALGALAFYRNRWATIGLFAVFATLNFLHTMGLAQIVPDHEFKLIGNPVKWLPLISAFLAGMNLFLFRDKIVYSYGLAYGAILVIVALVGSGHASWANAIFPIIGAYALIHTAFNPQLRGHNWAKYGDFSYGMYLYGFPVQQLWIRYLGAHLTPFTLLLLSAPTTLVLAILSWHLIEQPALRWKSKIGKAAPRETPKPAPILQPVPEEAPVATTAQ